MPPFPDSIHIEGIQSADAKLIRHIFLDYISMFLKKKKSDGNRLPFNLTSAN